ncbi:MAG TPA: type II secretion system protein GspG [Gemmatimonadales bacterium]|jgi:hypothetical protein|nr:type II secretion system protein GspG [Gemmatimonadales bacterium]
MAEPDTGPKKSAWPLFMLAALAFVPGVGFFCGAGAATWGLLSRRPRALVAAAIAGVGVVAQIVGFAAWLFFSAGRSQVINQALAEVARKDLVRLVRALEDYRAAKGAYPSSLTALAHRDLGSRSLQVYDQAAGVIHGLRLYQYRVATDGMSFDLYSVGPDRIPGTEDDIRPVLPESLAAHSGYRPPG